MLTTHDNNNKHIVISEFIQKHTKHTWLSALTNNVETILFERETFATDTFELNLENGIFIGLFIRYGFISFHDVSFKMIGELYFHKSYIVQKFIKYWFDKNKIKYTQKAIETFYTVKGMFKMSLSGKSKKLVNFLSLFVGKTDDTMLIPKKATLSKDFMFGILNGLLMTPSTEPTINSTLRMHFRHLHLGESILCIAKILGVSGEIFESKNIYNENVMEHMKNQEYMLLFTFDNIAKKKDFTSLVHMHKIVYCEKYPLTLDNEQHHKGKTTTTTHIFSQEQERALKLKKEKEEIILMEVQKLKNNKIANEKIHKNSYLAMHEKTTNGGGEKNLV